MGLAQAHTRPRQPGPLIEEGLLVDVWVLVGVGIGWQEVGERWEERRKAPSSPSSRRWSPSRLSKSTPLSSLPLFLISPPPSIRFFAMLWPIFLCRLLVGEGTEKKSWTLKRRMCRRRSFLGTCMCVFDFAFMSFFRVFELLFGLCFLDCDLTDPTSLPLFSSSTTLPLVRRIWWSSIRILSTSLFKTRFFFFSLTAMM